MKAMDEIDSLEEWLFVAAVLFPDGLELPQRFHGQVKQVVAFCLNDFPILSMRRYLRNIRSGFYLPEQRS